VTVGTTYTAYLCELNITPEPSNDSHASANCGTAPPGTSWIDASFSITAVTGIAQSALTLTSVSGVEGVPLTLAASGGSGTGAVTFSVSDGSASGCLITAGALSATSAGTCLVTATKAGDSTYLPISSTATAVALSAGHVAKLVTRSVPLSSRASTLPIKISCKESRCAGTISVSARITRKSLSAVTVVFGTGTYNIGVNSTKTVLVHLTPAARVFLTTFVDHPPLSGLVTVTDNLGKKHTYLGRVSLLK
jgi:hypothetical protein